MTPLTDSQKYLLRKGLREGGWVKHGQSGRAAKALARMGLAEWRGPQGGVGNYQPPVFRLTAEGRRVAEALGP